MTPEQRKKLLNVARQIELDGPNRPKFYMGTWIRISKDSWYDECGSAACMAGYMYFSLVHSRERSLGRTMEAIQSNPNRPCDTFGYTEMAYREFGLNRMRSASVFHIYDLTAEQAIELIRWAAKYGDWPRQVLHYGHGNYAHDLFNVKSRWSVK